MEDELASILKKLEYLEKRLQNIEEHFHVMPPVSPEKLPLMLEAAKLIRKIPQANNKFLQKALSLSQQDALELYDELEKRGMVATKEIINDPLQLLKIGSVSKYKIKKFLDENT